MGACVHSAPYLPCPNTGTLIPLTKALTRCSFGQATCHERSDGSHCILNLRCSDPAIIGFNKNIYLAVHMPVVSLNLNDQAYSAYKQIPRGSRSRVLSAMIAQRDLHMNHVGGELVKTGGLLEDLGYPTAGEAIIALKAMNSAQKKMIEQFQEVD